MYVVVIWILIVWDYFNKHWGHSILWQNRCCQLRRSYNISGSSCQSQYKNSDKELVQRSNTGFGTGNSIKVSRSCHSVPLLVPQSETIADTTQEPYLATRDHIYKLFLLCLFFFVLFSGFKLLCPKIYRSWYWLWGFCFARK